MPKGNPIEFSKDYIYCRTRLGENGCWNWTGQLDHKGYGHVCRQRKSEGRKTLKPHRIAWEQWNGQIPVGMCVCHKCDNPACCNPDHLFLGTHQDNYNDCRNKGRVKTGTKHHFSKLGINQIVEIFASDEDGKKIAPRYGIDPTGIRRLRRGGSYHNELAFILADVMFKTGWNPELSLKVTWAR